MKSGELFTRCLLACEAAAVEAGFLPEAGRDMCLGLIAKYSQDWSEETFGRWVGSMVERHGEKSPQGIELAHLYYKISQIIVSYGSLHSS
ncbi:MAG: hypothetical protein KME49_13775 [Brasilonema octagenarum HA4186-MV1]|jgi:hypothetical protein|nr:hypothetical protein [Brasilonema octagenarum HA4186-MV1]